MNLDESVPRKPGDLQADRVGSDIDGSKGRHDEEAIVYREGGEVF
jgi:hypothetical protein